MDIITPKRNPIRPNLPVAFRCGLAYHGTGRKRAVHLCRILAKFGAGVALVTGAAKANVALEGPMTGDEVAGLVAKVAQTPSSVVARITRMLADKK
jgi:hypothetical protein